MLSALLITKSERMSAFGMQGPDKSRRVVHETLHFLTYSIVFFIHPFIQRCDSRERTLQSCSRLLRLQRFTEVAFQTLIFWNLNRIFGEGPNFRRPVGITSQTLRGSFAAVSTPTKFPEFGIGIAPNLTCEPRSARAKRRRSCRASPAAPGGR